MFDHHPSFCAITYLSNVSVSRVSRRVTDHYVKDRHCMDQTISARLPYLYMSHAPVPATVSKYLHFSVCYQTFTHGFSVSFSVVIWHVSVGCESGCGCPYSCYPVLPAISANTQCAVTPNPVPHSHVPPRPPPNRSHIHCSLTDLGEGDDSYPSSPRLRKITHSNKCFANYIIHSIIYHQHIYLLTLSKR
jgi:hypothetical protein